MITNTNTNGPKSGLLLHTNKHLGTLAFWQVSKAWHTGEGQMTIQHALQQLNNAKGASALLQRRADVLIADIVHRNVDEPQQVAQ